MRPEKPPRGSLPVHRDERCDQAAEETAVGRYRKKPVEIDAIQWTGANIEEIWDAFGAGQIYGPTPDLGRDFLEIDTLEGRMRANNGDWIIRGVKGELYPCRDDIFTATYEPA